MSQDDPQAFRSHLTRRSPALRSPDRAAVIAAFLESAIGAGPIPVGELDTKARTAGLLGEHQHVGDAKLFKAAKKRLGIVSRRDGFGREGAWLWELPTPNTTLHQPTTPPVGNMSEGALFQPDDSAHSRLDQDAVKLAPAPDGYTGPLETAQARRLPQDWVRGVHQLQRQTRPAGIPQRQWLIFVEPCLRFLDAHSPWAGRAAELGWDSASLFGFRFERPHEHLGDAGLLWNLAGGKIVRLHKDGATIEAGDGRQRVFHRRPDRMTTTLPWDLP